MLNVYWSDSPPRALTTGVDSDHAPDAVHPDPDQVPGKGSNKQAGATTIGPSRPE
jgi:hypothetical protein